jgi:hypothetical protein
MVTIAKKMAFFVRYTSISVSLCVQEQCFGTCLHVRTQDASFTLILLLIYSSLLHDLGLWPISSPEETAGFMSFVGFLG